MFISILHWTLRSLYVYALDSYSKLRYKMLICMTCVSYSRLIERELQFPFMALLISGKTIIWLLILSFPLLNVLVLRLACVWVDGLDWYLESWVFYLRNQGQKSLIQNQWNCKYSLSRFGWICSFLSCQIRSYLCDLKAVSMQVHATRSNCHVIINDSILIINRGPSDLSWCS
jgi:hypothetical protein